MAKWLVTGGAGFIGSHLIDALLGRGDSVVCVDSMNDAYDVAIKVARYERHRQDEGYRNILDDINSLLSNDWKYALKDVDVVAHLAARAGGMRVWACLRP